MAEANAAGEFEMAGAEIFTIGDSGHWWYRVTVLVGGRRFIGTAEIKFGARAGTPDAESPVECAETSAVGRALGFAGFGADEGIASADELQRAREAQPRQQSQQRQAPAQAVPASALGWNPLSDTEFRRRCRGVGRVSVQQVDELVASVTPEGAHPHRERCFEALTAEEQRAREVMARVGQG